MKKHGRPLKYLSIFFVLLSSLASLPASAEKIGTLATQGRETLKISKCRALGYNDFSSYVFLLRENGSWDFYDGESDVYAPTLGTYSGSLNARKLTLSSSEAFSQLMKAQLEETASQLCGEGGVITSHSPFTYQVKINKNRTSAKVTLKTKLKALSYYGVKANGSFSLAGQGNYSIEDTEQNPE